MAIAFSRKKLKADVSGLLPSLATWAIFFREFVQHPKMVGSAFPSSRALVSRMLAPVDWAQAKLIVEYGPGTGSFTRAILGRMRSDATLIAIDTNGGFIEHLNATIADRRFQATTGSAANVREILARNGLEKADIIISGLPFSTLPPRVGQAILGETSNALHAHGMLLLYQWSRTIETLMSHILRMSVATANG